MPDTLPPGAWSRTARGRVASHNPVRPVRSNRWSALRSLRVSRSGRARCPPFFMRRRVSHGRATLGSNFRDTALAREELQHQAVHLGRVLVGGPVPGPGDPVHVERADGLADLADQSTGGPKRGIVALAPEEPDSTAELSEVAEERPAGADLAAVEAGATNAAGLDVHGLLGDARRILEHVDEQVVAADLAEARLVVTRLLVAPDRALAEAAQRKAAGRDETEVGHARTDPQSEVGGDGPAEREAGEAQRRLPRKHLDDERVHEIEVGRPGHVAGDRRGLAIRRVIERVHAEARRQRLDVADPVPPRAHAPVKEDDVGAAAATVYRHPGDVGPAAVGGHLVKKRGGAG